MDDLQLKNKQKNIDRLEMNQKIQQEMDMILLVGIQIVD
jgi:hypothetical protein